jgi:gliding motility-associated-like protein
MKNFSLSILVFCFLFSKAQVSIQCNAYYAISGSSVFVSSPGIPNSSTLLPVTLPNNSAGLAIGPSLGFNAPNPTLWTISGGTYWYYNGFNFVNTNDNAGFGATNPGGSKNCLYNFSPLLGLVYKYDGTGNATLLNTVNFFNGGPADIAADDNNNFYVLRLQNPQALLVFDSLGVQTCSYSVSGITSAGGGAAMAIIDNTVTVQNGAGYFVGLISNTTVNFTSTARSYANPSDFASCARLVAYSPTITASPSASITCNNPTVALTMSTAINVSGYLWQGPGIIGGSTLQTVQVFVPGVYSCLINSTCEGGASVTTFTIVNSAINPTVNTSSTKTVICDGESTTLFTSGANSFTWQPSGLTGSVLVVSPNTTTTYTVTGEIAGCIGTETILITVNPSPTVNAVANPTVLCAGGSTTLTAFGSTNYTWMPGNFQGSTAVVSPSSTTTYTVISALGNCTAGATAIVFNPSSPVLLSSGSTLTCTHPTVQLVVINNAINNVISWSGTGITSPNSSTTLSLTVPGVYKLTVTNTITNCVSIDSVNIIDEIGPLNLNIVSSATQICYPSSVGVNMQVNTPANCVWTPTTDITPVNGPLVTANPSVTTTYTLTGVLGICTASTAITISVNLSPIVIAASVNNLLCAGLSNTLVATGASNYTWQPGNLTGASVTVNSAVSTIYTVTGETDNCLATDFLGITILPAPRLFPTVWPVVICPTNNSTLTASDAVSYTWQPGGFITSTLVVNPSVTSVYTVTGINSSGCVASSTAVVTVNQGPAIEVAVTNNNICLGDSVTISALNAISYSLFPTSLTGTLLVVKPLETFNYTVAASNTACLSYSVVTISVVPCLGTSFGIANSASRPRLENGDVYRIDFSITTNNNGERPLNTIKLINDLKTTFLTPGTYTVINPPSITSVNSKLKPNAFYNGTTDINLLAEGSILDPGKTDTLAFTVLLEPNGYYGKVVNSVTGVADYFAGVVARDTSNNGFDPDPDQDGNPTNNNLATPIEIDFINLFIPQGISPNGDDNNDRFEIKGLYGRPIKLTIFNRWGNKVYEKDKYDNSWDGRPNVSGVSLGTGKLPASTYYYILQFQDGKKELKTGFVVLNY